MLFIGIGGAMSQMLKLTDGALATSGSMMLIICFVLGGLVGELLNIEGTFERFGAWLRKKTHNESDSGFLSGFIHASLTVCIGAMAIVGSIQDGLLGDASLLCAKAALDAVIILVMTASMGKGCIFSAIPVAILQGGVTLLSRVIAPVMTDAAIASLSFTGSVMIFCVGVNLIWGKTIKVANLLPTLVFAVVYTFFVLSIKISRRLRHKLQSPGFRLFFRSLAGLDARDIVRHGLVDKVVEPVAVEQVRARAPRDKRRFLRVIAREIVLRHVNRHIGRHIAQIFPLERVAVIFRMPHQKDLPAVLRFDGVNARSFRAREDLELRHLFDVLAQNRRVSRMRHPELVVKAAERA